MTTPSATEFQELARTLGWLAAEGDEVLASLPRVRRKIDTLALDYFYAREVVYREHSKSLDEECLQALQSLDQMLEAHAGVGHAEFWTAEALRVDSGWAEIREAARATLLIFDKHVETWCPTPLTWLEALISDEVKRLTPEKREVFEHHRVPIRRVSIERSSALEPVFVVLEAFGRVVFWDDVEEGFEWATLDDEGALCDYACGQYELSHILWQIAEDEKGSS